MDLKHREEGMVFYQVFLLFSFAVYSIGTGETVRGCVSPTHEIWQTVTGIYGSAREMLVPANGDAFGYSMRHRDLICVVISYRFL